jgi:hypothetical protein
VTAYIKPTKPSQYSFWLELYLSEPNQKEQLSDALQTDFMTMSGITRSILLIACYLSPLIATVILEHAYTDCFRPIEFAPGRKPLNIQSLRHDCYAALSIMPNTGVEVDPNDMAKNALKPDSQKLFSLRLTGNDTYSVNGDKIRLPAIFASGDCFIRVTIDGGRIQSRGAVLFQHIYTWPVLRKWAYSLLKTCLVPRRKCHSVSGADLVGIGRSSGRYDSLILRTYLYVKGSTEEPNRPQFSDREKLNFRDFNVYTPTGQINDNR